MQQTSSPSAGAVIPVVGVGVGVVLIVIGQFLLDTLADTSVTWHYLQHGVFVAGGIVIGIAATRLYALGQRHA
jgi:multisubunit Na+/H+ antiporter MnhB subunit